MKKKSYAFILTALTVLLLIFTLCSCDIFSKKQEGDMIWQPDTTAPGLGVSIVKCGYDYFSFSVNKSVTHSGGTFTYDIIFISLKKDGKTVQETKDTNTTRFDGLEHSTTYQLVIKYTSSDSDEVKVRTLSVTTKAKKIPTVDVFNYVVSPTSIKASLNITDNENILKSYCIDLYDGKTLIATRSDGIIEFSGIEPMKEYTLKVRATLDRRDGKYNTEEIIFERSIKVPPNVGVSTVTLLSPDTSYRVRMPYSS